MFSQLFRVHGGSAGEKFDGLLIHISLILVHRQKSTSMIYSAILGNVIENRFQPSKRPVKFKQFSSAVVVNSVPGSDMTTDSDYILDGRLYSLRHRNNPAFPDRKIISSASNVLL
jgi:hypothetical protein